MTLQLAHEVRSLPSPNYPRFFEVPASSVSLANNSGSAWVRPRARPTKSLPLSTSTGFKDVTSEQISTSEPANVTFMLMFLIPDAAHL